MISIWAFIVALVGFSVICFHLWFTNATNEDRIDTLTEEFYNAYLVAQCYIEKYGEMTTEEMQKTKVVQEFRKEAREGLEELF